MNLIELLINPIPGSITGSLSYDLLKSIFDKLRSSESKIDSLLYSTFGTGMRLAQESILLPVNSKEERAVFCRHLEQAIWELEKSLELLPRKKRYDGERSAAEIMLALCYMVLYGEAGKPIASRRWSSVKPLFVEHQNGLEHRASHLRDTARSERAHNETYKRTGVWPDFVAPPGDGEWELNKAIAIDDKVMDVKRFIALMDEITSAKL